MNREKSSTRILLVEDDPLSRELLVLLLENEGYTVDASDSGDAALLHLRSSSTAHPQVVLTDLHMPGIAGKALGEQLRHLTGTGTILLAMSASEPEKMALGEFNGFLLKPFTMQAVAAAIAGGHIARIQEGHGNKPVVLNETIYSKLAGSMRPSQTEQLYALCLKDAEGRIDKMREFASGQDDDAYRKEAHAIKGSCGMVGAAELQTLATSMEERGLNDANHVATLDEFASGCDRLRRILVARAGE